MPAATGTGVKPKAMPQGTVSGRMQLAKRSQDAALVAAPEMGPMAVNIVVCGAVGCCEHAGVRSSDVWSSLSTICLVITIIYVL